MCKILNVFYFDNKVSLSCSGYDGNFKEAKLLKIVDKDGKNIQIKNFSFEINRNCFSVNKNKPWIIVDGQANNEFFEVGNEVVLI